MIEQLETLQAIIEDAVADATCDVSGVIITAGRPAAPSEEGRDCQTVIYVWGSNVSDFNQVNPTSCVVRSRFAMSYEIQTCYPEGWEDQINTDGAATSAECLYELMRLVWCELVTAKDAGEFCPDCSAVELQPLETQPRSGGAVSALGGVVVPYTCPVVEASPSSP